MKAPMRPAVRKMIALMIPTNHSSLPSSDNCMISVFAVLWLLNQSRVLSVVLGLDPRLRPKCPYLDPSE